MGAFSGMRMERIQELLRKSTRNATITCRFSRYYLTLFAMLRGVLWHTYFPGLPTSLKAILPFPRPVLRHRVLLCNNPQAHIERLESLRQRAFSEKQLFQYHLLLLLRQLYWPRHLPDLSNFLTLLPVLLNSFSALESQVGLIVKAHRRQIMSQLQQLW